jgi:signal transduction histidine kinase
MDGCASQVESLAQLRERVEDVRAHLQGMKAELSDAFKGQFTLLNERIAHLSSQLTEQAGPQLTTTGQVPEERLDPGLAATASISEKTRSPSR